MSTLDTFVNSKVFGYLSKTVAPVARGFLLPIGFRPILEPKANNDKVKYIVVEILKEHMYDVRLCDDDIIKTCVNERSLITYVLPIEDRIDEVMNYVYNVLHSVLSPLLTGVDKKAFVFKGIRYLSIEHFSRAKGMTYRFAHKWLIENNVIMNRPRKYVRNWSKKNVKPSI